MKFSHKYIIVGAGSAGCVLANKLSEDPKNSVLLIEAGPLDSSYSIKMPLAASSLFKSKKYGWGYETEPEKNLNNRTINWPRGKTLGGSSSINGMLYVRGQADDYDNWEQLGNNGWGYRDLLKYFIALENNQNHEDQFHGNFGPLWVETFQPILDASKEFLKACSEFGFKNNNDFNGAEQEGFGQYQVNIKDGKKAAIASLEALCAGTSETTFRLRDWGVSRQRYWGCPIPMIHCPDCGVLPVPEEDLPVVLPTDVTLDGVRSPLVDLPEFLDVACPQCGGAARRETDTFDTFMESSWYFTRFASPDADVMVEEPAKYWAPIDHNDGRI